MKCPRNKFVDLDYATDVILQKQEICRGCADYNGKEWGKHCGADVACVKCGIPLGQAYFDKLPKENRSLITHGICETCRKAMSKIIDAQRRKLGRTPW